MQISKIKKELLCKYVDFICEVCHKPFEIDELHIHRINRGYKGGIYKDFKNLMVVCKEDHKKIHGREFK